MYNVIATLPASGIIRGNRMYKSMLSGRCEKVKVMGSGKVGEGGEVGGHRLRPGENVTGQR